MSIVLGYIYARAAMYCTMRSASLFAGGMAHGAQTRSFFGACGALGRHKGAGWFLTTKSDDGMKFCKNNTLWANADN